MGLLLPQVVEERRLHQPLDPLLTIGVEVAQLVHLVLETLDVIRGKIRLRKELNPLPPDIVVTAVLVSGILDDPIAY